MGQNSGNLITIYAPYRAVSDLYSKTLLYKVRRQGMVHSMQLNSQNFAPFQNGNGFMTIPIPDMGVTNAYKSGESVKLIEKSDLIM